MVSAHCAQHHPQTFPSHEILKNVQKLTRHSQILFVVNQPDVYRSPNSNTWMYVQRQLIGARLELIPI